MVVRQVSISSMGERERRENITSRQEQSILTRKIWGDVIKVLLSYLKFVFFCYNTYYLGPKKYVKKSVHFLTKSNLSNRAPWCLEAHCCVLIFLPTRETDMLCCTLSLYFFRQKDASQFPIGNYCRIVWTLISWLAASYTTIAWQMLWIFSSFGNYLLAWSL